jgi:hypothetical protein
MAMMSLTPYKYQLYGSYGRKKRTEEKHLYNSFFKQKRKKKTTIIPIQSFPPPSTKKKTYIKQNLSSISSHSTSVFIMREQKTFFPTFQILLNNNMQKLG